jgi:multidrug efflux system outer membrane protein
MTPEMNFEVLEAQQQLYPAQNTLAQIRRDRLLTHVRLYKALGGGLEPERRAVDKRSLAAVMAREQGEWR